MNNKLGIGIAVIVIGIGLTFFGFNMLNKAKESVNWPTTTGKITYANVKRTIKRTSSNRDRDGVSVNVGPVTVGTGGDRRYVYYPEIKYEYTVDNQKYIGKKISLASKSHKSKHSAQKIIDKYSLGTNVNVYYNPKKPQDALLVTGVTLGSYIPIIVGIIFTIGGAVAAFKPE
jgi:hypothetical protein